MHFTFRSAVLVSFAFSIATSLSSSISKHPPYATHGDSQHILKEAQVEKIETPRHSVLDDIREQYKLPCLTAGWSNESSFLFRVTGLRKVGAPKLVQSNDQFHLGSLTKAMTSTLLALLIKDGLLTWKMKYEDVFPDLEIAEGHRGTSLRMLTSHHSGIAINYLKYPLLWRSLFSESLKPTDGRWLLTKRALSRPPEAQPGHFKYDNTNFIIAGSIIDRITNSTWEDVIQERLFKPLDMQNCGFGPNDESSNISVDNPWPHVAVFQRFAIPVWWLPWRLRDNPSAADSAGRVHCPMRSYDQFLRAHVDGAHGIDNALGLSAADFQALHTPYGDSLYTPGGWDWTNLTTDGSEYALTHEGSNTYNHAISRLDIRRWSRHTYMSMTNVGGQSAELANLAVIKHLSEGTLTLL